jgi:hypothetical protein
VDADVQRAEALVDHPLEVRLGEAGQRGEVPVEEREPVVVVLDVEALPHAGGQLVDEAERAVVVAGADSVEQGRGHLGPERLPGLLGDLHRALHAAPPQFDVDHGLVGQHPVADDVARNLAVHDDEFIPRHDPGPGGRRPRSHGHHTRQGHSARKSRRGTAPNG